ncbi:MAG: FUN14 domain-containing protein [Thermus sp.]|uniref:FUN14 domain-containing protein n=1 Tax=unclassified Thermus TaxID=2619321 RepID=UPI00059BD263|nr:MULTISPECIES: FUN14 domain-containing protein [unclassified Thermus]MCS6869643.1 FUN14 domain-containing protein [Thermus sp.]MCS7217419.1 FUN14 domain-containing protein [Thermus sp.]MCX7848764.1 FUN14 domain-containing protein [Thermus sp.]MDW8016656.1 FUN14 domain-containing protein [Thermus sp.]MDW8358162.1 FUN14 domain-containing protein [Thermus sp.]
MELPDLTPYLGQMTFGGLAGYAVGFALKKVGRLLAFSLGLLFVALQLLAQAGYVQVDWTRIQKEVEPLLQGPGLKNLWEGLLRTLTYNLPFGASFMGGFLLGLRAG